MTKGSRAALGIVACLAGCDATHVPDARDAASDATHVVDALALDAAPAPRSVEDDLVVTRRVVVPEDCPDWDTRSAPTDPVAAWSRDIGSAHHVHLVDDGSIRLLDDERVLAFGRDGSPEWSRDLAGASSVMDVAPDGSVFAFVRRSDTEDVLVHVDGSGVIVDERSFERLSTARWGVGSVVVGPRGRVYVTTDRVHELCRTTLLAELSIADAMGVPRDAGWVAIDRDGALLVTVRDVSRALRLDPVEHLVEWMGTGVPTTSTFASGPLGFSGTRVLVAHTEIDRESPEPMPTWSLSIAQPGGWSEDVAFDVLMLDARGRTVRDQGAGWGRFWDRDDGSELTLPCDAVHWATERGLLCSAIVDARVVLREIDEAGSIAFEHATGVPSSRGLGSVRLGTDGRIVWRHQRDDAVTFVLASVPSDVRPAVGWWSWLAGAGRAWAPPSRE